MPNAQRPSLELLFLGTGTSAGIPMIGCDCDVCHSRDPRDQRTRPSVAISYPDPDPDTDVQRCFIVDTAPEFRQQIIRADIQRIDGVFYTHAHADHIFGLDDLRRFNVVMDAPIYIYSEARTLDVLRGMFQYIFDSGKNVNKSFIPKLVPTIIKPGEAVEHFGATWTPLRLMHGRLPMLGFRVDHQGQSLAYCTDVSSIPPETYPLLQGLDVLVIDALRYRHHPTHLTIDQALGEIDQIKPKRAYLTHIAHDVEHSDLESELPEGVYLSFDGLVVSVGDQHRGSSQR